MIHDVSRFDVEVNDAVVMNVCQSNTTHLLEQNIHPKIVSERLGHSTIALPMNTYSHVMPTMQEEAANKVHDMLGNSGK